MRRPRPHVGDVLGLIDPRGVLDDLANAEDLAEFWWRGGTRFCEPLGDGRAAVCLLLQPDGDVVLMLPMDFGTVAGDQEVARGMISNAIPQITAMADHYGRAVRRLAERAAALGLAPVWIAGAAGTIASELQHLSWIDLWPLVAPAVLTGFRARLIRAVTRCLFAVARKKAFGGAP